MGKGFDYRGGGALVILTVPHATQALLMGPSSILDQLTTYSQASFKAHHSSYRALYLLHRASSISGHKKRLSLQPPLCHLYFSTWYMNNMIVGQKNQLH